MNKTAHELFLLMGQLFQINSEDKVKSIYINSINSLNQDFSLSDRQSVTHKFPIEVCTVRKTYAYLYANKKISTINQIFSQLLMNSIQMLAVIFERIEYEKLINEQLSQKEKKLNKSKSLIKKAQEIGNIGSWELDLKTKEIKASEEAYRIYGFDKRQRITLEDLKQRYLPEYKERIIDYFEYINHHQTQESKVEFEYKIKRLNDKKIIDIYSISEYDPITHTAAGIIQDITEKKHIEEKYQRLIQTTGDIIFIHDKKGIIKFVNKAGLEFTKYSLEEFKGKNVSDFLPKSEISALLKRKNQRIKNGEKSRSNFETCFYNKKGQKIYVDVQSTPIFENGKLKEVLVVARNISRRKLAEKEQEKLRNQLQHAQKMEAVGTLTGGIAHDFNNLLTPILGYAELIRDSLPEESQFTEDLDEIIAASEKAKKLIEQLLTFSRKKKERIKAIDIAPVIKESLKLIRSSLPATINIHKKIHTNTDNIMANPTQIHQLIMNLCINAAHAMEDKNGTVNNGNIYVGLEKIYLDEESSQDFVNLEAGNHLHLTVEDNGKGMDDKTLSHIFEPFFTTKIEGKGSGMGLAVVHGIVKSYNGAIKVYSDIGKGTTFNIYFPVTNKKGEEISNKKSSKIRGKQERIFIIDDRKYVTKALSKILSRHNFRVESSNSSTKALQHLRGNYHKYDLLITDLTMPELSGIQIAEKLKKDKIEIPIILLTGYAYNFRDNLKENTEIKHIIQKPVISNQIIPKINDLLKDNYERK